MIYNGYAKRRANVIQYGRIDKCIKVIWKYIYIMQTLEDFKNPLSRINSKEWSNRQIDTRILVCTCHRIFQTYIFHHYNIILYCVDTKVRFEHHKLNTFIPTPMYILYSDTERFLFFCEKSYSCLYETFQWQGYYKRHDKWTYLPIYIYLTVITYSSRIKMYQLHE